jgi:amidohydrolase
MLATQVNLPDEENVVELDAAIARNLATQLEKEVIAWRRRLHKYPELSYTEEATGQFVAATLSEFGGIEISRPAGHSVVGRIRGSHPGKVVALRADMDALPITEETALEYKSQNVGIMHACGHDGHTAMLLGTAKVLAAMKDELAGEVRLLFQHAEEKGPGGATEMIAAGVMEGVDAVIGAHLWSPLECGRIGISRGAMMAATDAFDISIKGEGGHASRPQDVTDSIAIAAQVVTNLQHIVARNTDPLDSLVVSVSTFNAGTAHNVIPGEVKISGTVRSFREEVRATVPELMERIIDGVTKAHGATYRFEYKKGSAAVINQDDVNRVIENAARELFGEEAIDYDQKNMGGEDFSAFQGVTPGVFFYVGARNQAKQAVYPHHHPRFAIDEDALVNGVQVFLLATSKLMAGENLTKCFY